MQPPFVRVETTVEIERTPQSVFDYVTTPALWHTWHPATAAVRDVADRPLVEGETVVEIIAMAGRTTEALWTVVACEPPRRWQIETDAPKGSARIVYRIEPTPRGCRFHRTLDFRSKGRLWRMLDSTLTRLFLVRQSARALRQLKQVLER
jgi:uncharacterized protein YndB with AHSA1/START domain